MTAQVLGYIESARAGEAVCTAILKHFGDLMMKELKRVRAARAVGRRRAHPVVVAVPSPKEYQKLRSLPLLSQNYNPLLQLESILLMCDLGVSEHRKFMANAAEGCGSDLASTWATNRGRSILDSLRNTSLSSSPWCFVVIS